MNYKKTTLSGLMKLFILTVAVIAAVACVRDDLDFSDRIRYNPTFLLPLGHGKLTMENILKSDDIVHADPDNSIRLVMREDSILTLSLTEALSIPLPDTISKSFETSNIAIDEFTTASDLTLEEITTRMAEPSASQIREADGKTVVFPGIPEQNLGIVDIDDVGGIEYAEFEKGELEISVENNLPVAVSIDVALINGQSQVEIGQLAFTDIAPGQTASHVMDLAGKSMQDVAIEILKFSSQSSSSPVEVNLSDEIRINVEGRNLEAVRGRGKFKRTLLGSGTSSLKLNFENDVRLDELVIKNGIFNYLVDNSSGLTVDVNLANITTNDDKCSFSIITDGTGDIREGSTQLTDMEVEIADDVRIIIEYELYAGSDGDEVTAFDVTGDSFDFKLWFSDFQLEYASGYFDQGEFTFDIDDIGIDFGLFNKMSGNFKLTKPLLRIFYENRAGLPVDLLMNIEGVSADGTKSANMFDEDLRRFKVGQPTDPYTPFNGEIEINYGSSNLVDFISLPPAIMKPTLSARINPDGETDTPNFITSCSEAVLGLEFQLPLEMQLSDLYLVDTMKINTGDISNFEKLLLDITVTNGFPVGASVDLSLYDSIAGHVLHTFNEVLLIESAEVDENGLVIENGEKTTEGYVELEGTTLDLLRKADHVIISASFYSAKNENDDVPVRFLTTDRLDFRVRLKAGVGTGN